MGVYVGMEMPKGCFFYPFNRHLDPDTDKCVLTRDAFDSTFRVVEHRRDNCPLVPVQKHGRLGDLDALAEYVHQQDDWLSETAIHAFCGILCKTPTIIDAEEGE